MANPNIELLTSIANAMGELREQVVFVGGCATGLLITQPNVADARATEDVDAIVEVASLVSAPYFMATKLEAFKDRGNNDVYLSHDLEDIISVVDGREELLQELTAAPPEVRSFVAHTFQGILKHPDFTNVLPGIVSQSARTGLVLQRFTKIAEL